MQPRSGILNTLSVSPGRANQHHSAALPTFRILENGRPERRVTLDQDVIRIGRAPNAELHLESVMLSRLHAVIESSGGGLTVVDLGSNSGTFVNEERTNKRALLPGDRIRVGDVSIVLEPASSELRLPTPEKIRAIVGDSFRPTEVFGVAALVLHVDGIRRTGWSDEAELSERLFESYPRGDVPAPEEPTSRRGTYKTIDDAAPTRVQRCSACVVRPGFSPCTLCMGTGAGASSDLASRCMACDGGFISCTTCEGTTRVVACSIRYVNDELVRVRRALVPAMHASVRSFVEARIPVEASWPSEQAFDPEPSLVGSAYRGAAAARAAEDFHGFFFGDAAAQCLAARDELTTGLSRFETKTFAVPILWTVTRERHGACFFDPNGVLQRVGDLE